MDKKQLYLDKVKAQIEQHSANVALLRAKAAETDANIKLEYLEQVHTLEKKLDGLKDNYRQLRESDDNAWDKIKDATESAWSSFTDAIEKVTKRN
jgi:hypothetical protein